MLIPFGVLSAAGAGGVAGDYELIASEILTASQASITFSNLGDYSSTYKHLQIRFVGRTVRTDLGRESVSLRFNGVSTTSYRNHELIGTGSAVQSAASAGANRCAVASVSTNLDASNIFGLSVIDILDAYSSTKNKTVRSLAGRIGSSAVAAPVSILFFSSLFDSTASTTSLELFGDVSNFVAGSRFSLYGIKG
jgi:hypothetical protein